MPLLARLRCFSVAFQDADIYADMRAADAIADGAIALLAR